MRRSPDPTAEQLARHWEIVHAHRGLITAVCRRMSVDNDLIAERMVDRAVDLVVRKFPHDARNPAATVIQLTRWAALNILSRDRATGRSAVVMTSGCEIEDVATHDMPAVTPTLSLLCSLIEGLTGRDRVLYQCVYEQDATWAQAVAGVGMHPASAKQVRLNFLGRLRAACGQPQPSSCE